MSIDASELNPRIRRRPVLGRIYLAASCLVLVIAWLGLLVFGAIEKAVVAAFVAACQHVRTTLSDGCDLLGWAVRHIFNRWDDSDSGKTDS